MALTGALDQREGVLLDLGFARGDALVDAAVDLDPEAVIAAGAALDLVPGPKTLGLCHDAQITPAGGYAFDSAHVAALFVETGGAYYGVPNVDPWDTQRDARLYAGPWPVVAHPPCSSWCQIAFVNQKRWGRRVGDDGGCFAAALAAVRRWGGVLEHPAHSYAWPAFGLPEPIRGAWRRDWVDGAWVTEVCQRAYGHRARKATWLYYVGPADPPGLDWRCPRPEATVSQLTNHGGGDLPRLSKREASTTPAAFRDLLIAIARSVAL